MNSPLVRRMLFLALAFILVLFFLVYSPSIDSVSELEAVRHALGPFC